MFVFAVIGVAGMLALGLGLGYMIATVLGRPDGYLGPRQTAFRQAGELLKMADRAAEKGKHGLSEQLCALAAKMTEDAE